MRRLTRSWFPACLVLVSFCGLPSVAAVGAEQSSGGQPVEAKGDGVYNAVEGQTTVTFLRPAGARVKKGDLVCELESFAVRTRLAAQEAATEAALGLYQNAKRSREIAELSITEYVEAVYSPQLRVIDQKISLADAVVKRAIDSLETAKRLVEKGLGPKSRVDSAELNVQQARLALEKAQREKETLQKYTKERKIKELQSKVERARAVELARQADYGREQAVQDQLKKQLERCKLLAPADGRVSYPEQVEEGAEVTGGQLLFRVVPEADSKATAK
jgi:multidrug resistance efflux pump